ncbi:MAG TPA: hypothetical protein VGG29_14420 [Caulobacteraceae bacterium]|jgi:hypothetical protein
MRLSSIIPWTGPAVSPARKDEKGGRPKSNQEDRGHSGRQARAVGSQPDEDPPDHVDIKV